MKVVFERRLELVPTVWEYSFRPERRVDYIPGQYVDVHLHDVPNDPRGLSRTFTLTSLPSDELLSFVVKIPEPHTAYKQALTELRPGDEAKIDDAMGDLVLPKSPAVPLIFVAGGIGMASFTAMLKELERQHDKRTVHLFYSLRGPYDDAFNTQVDSFPFASKRRFFRPERLGANDIVSIADDDSLIYLSGSENFVQGLRDQLHVLGFSHSRIVFDFYDGYADL